MSAGFILRDPCISNQKKERLTVATDGLREITAHHRVIGQTTDHNSLEVLVKERFFFFYFKFLAGCKEMSLLHLQSVCGFSTGRELNKVRKIYQNKPIGYIG